MPILTPRERVLTEGLPSEFRIERPTYCFDHNHSEHLWAEVGKVFLYSISFQRKVKGTQPRNNSKVKEYSGKKRLLSAAQGRPTVLWGLKQILT